MRKLLFFGVVFILVCIFGFTMIVSEAEPQTNNTNTEIIEPINDINTTMIIAKADLNTDGLDNVTKSTESSESIEYVEKTEETEADR